MIFIWNAVAITIAKIANAIAKIANAIANAIAKIANAIAKIANAITIENIIAKFQAQSQTQMQYQSLTQ